MDENDVPIPSYDDIFCPPKPKLREPNRMYGKKLLEMYFDEQHRVLLDNYRMVRGWFKNYPFVDDLHHNRLEQQKIHDLISTKIGELAPLKFGLGKATYKWEETHIYHFVLTYAQSQQKYDKKTTTNDAHETAKKGNAGTIALKGSTVEMASRIELVDISPKLCDDVGKETHVDCMPLAIQNQAEGTSRLIVSLKMLGYQTVDSVSSSYQTNNHEASQKSTRERKISAKLKESLATKLGKETSKKLKKKTKDEKCIAGDTSNVYVPKFDEVSSLNVEEEETILLKYFDLQIIDDMYLVLKASYDKIKREESSFF